MLRKQPRQTSSPFRQQFLTHGEIIFTNEESPELGWAFCPVRYVRRWLSGAIKLTQMLQKRLERGYVHTIILRPLTSPQTSSISK